MSLLMMLVCSLLSHIQGMSSFVASSEEEVCSLYLPTTHCLLAC